MFLIIIIHAWLNKHDINVYLKDKNLFFNIIIFILIFRETKALK